MKPYMLRRWAKNPVQLIDIVLLFHSELLLGYTCAFNILQTLAVARHFKCAEGLQAEYLKNSERFILVT